ncbi:MAG: proteasome subunit beta [Myxococcota bacterium]
MQFGGARYDGSSFVELLKYDYKELSPKLDLAGEAGGKLFDSVPHGTTVVSLKYADGALIAGDRLATEGYQVAMRTIEKVFKTDEHSAMAIAGAAGPCVEMARLFRIELEHYEKLEGVPLDLEGKANKLGQMIRQNLPMAMQGLVVVPLFAGYDLKLGVGRIFKYDVTGGHYEEIDYYAVGSGGKDARSSLKKTYKPGANEEAAVRMVLEALFDAADEDRGTGGVDTVRGIYPTIKLVTRKGISDIGEARIKAKFEEIVKARREVEAA